MELEKITVWVAIISISLFLLNFLPLIDNSHSSFSKHLTNSSEVKINAYQNSLLIVYSNCNVYVFGRELLYPEIRENGTSVYYLTVGNYKIINNQSCGISIVELNYDWFDRIPEIFIISFISCFSLIIGSFMLVKEISKL
jgi:hypothetical protein